MQPDGMRLTRAGWLRWVLLTSALARTLMTPSTGSAEEPAPVPVQSWEAGVRKSFFIPTLEIGGFIVGLNQVDRHFVDAKVKAWQA